MAGDWWQWSVPVTGRLVVTADLLLAHNADGTFTVWDRTTHTVLFDLYLFRGFDWLAVARGGSYTHSPGAQRYLGDASRRY